MNETLIKKFIGYKLSTADKIINYLPLEVSKELRDLGRIILESLNENAQKIKEKPSVKSKDKLNNITIE
ncbi:hypothetical protein SAMN05443428_10275 [Caloramator quimbayensis]|uniref:Uncharacterized protein n=1 Tax=Caloramator quimbayensis TaxID=1147123 RepID=A0A1T4WLW4_9CLOT|nr:hypothetical protein [Caloramator quimbayensis]SKA77865.1 hypothetical protein SAMN05443428_10275 [Caloramator quimbayensis]